MSPLRPMRSDLQARGGMEESALALTRSIDQRPAR